MTLPDDDVTHVARAAAEIARGITAGDDCVLEVHQLAPALVPRPRPRLTPPRFGAARRAYAA